MTDLRKNTGITTGFTLLCSSLAILFIKAKNNELAYSIVFAGLSWIGYLIIHKSDTGHILDTRESIEKQIESKNEEKWSPQKRKALAGPLIFVTGMIIGSQGVILENYLLAFVGASGVIGGYAIAHYFIEGELF